MLGHARLDTTQMYTEVSIGQLKEVHAWTHSGNRAGIVGTWALDRLTFLEAHRFPNAFQYPEPVDRFSPGIQHFPCELAKESEP